jgi:hypothetical protein
MRIGMMLRAADEKGGVGVYTRNLIRELCEMIDQPICSFLSKCDKFRKIFSL